MELSDWFMELADSGVPASIALSKAVELAAYKVTALVKSGMELEDGLRQLGVENPQGVATRILAQYSAGETPGQKRRPPVPGAETFGPATRPGLSRGRAEEIVRHGPEILTSTTFSVLVGGGVKGVPTPACIEAHLPPGRKPTLEELKKAWEACK